MNTIILGSGTITIDGQTFALVGEPKRDEQGRIGDVGFAEHGWSGTVTLDVQDSPSVAAFFDQMEAAYRERQVQALQNQIAKAMAYCTPPKIERERPRVAQWKQERSPMRYR